MSEFWLGYAFGCAYTLTVLGFLGALNFRKAK